jgi:esterase/lipase superfamily enzyme
LLLRWLHGRRPQGRFQAVDVRPSPDDVRLHPRIISLQPGEREFEPGAREPEPAEAELEPEPAGEPFEPAAPSRQDKEYVVVKVFYGTDRAIVGSCQPERSSLLWWLGWTLSTGLLATILAIVAFRPSRTRPRPYWILFVLAVPVILGLVTANAALVYVRAAFSPNRPQLAFGSDRGTRLQLGTCQVSIPMDHEPGELESPSILRLELLEDPRRHVTLLEVTSRPAEEFYAELTDRVKRSRRRAAFVFVHGFNVTFKQAARRTAQMAHDLEYDGAPIFYSWPSKGGLLPYSVDEANVDWTVSHLKQFLNGIAKQCGARNVHLIAHSMGNRALTDALRDFSFQPDGTRPVFQEVVLTAPDIDAAVFETQIAPAIVKTAERTTLYASSKDWALYASKRVHGYPRAGEGGEGLVVLPNIDTVDASAVDTSLLGHSYVGDSGTVLVDLAELLHEAKPPANRKWLRARDRGPLTYWVLRRN